MFLCLKKWSIIAISSFCLSLFLFGGILYYGQALQTANYSVPGGNGEASPVLIIDPGHGGEDGGAVAQDGTIESGINLNIALQMENAANLCGWETLMTRREDMSIHDSNCSTLRQKKVSDLKNRAAICRDTDNGILISIHQNSLPQAPSVRGAQVFYNNEPGSQELAQAIQEALNNFINYDTPKTAKKIPQGIYLMEHADCPAVLVECGFLSNPDETTALKTSAYQKKLSTVILAAVTDHITANK